MDTSPHQSMPSRKGTTERCPAQGRYMGSRSGGPRTLRWTHGLCDRFRAGRAGDLVGTRRARDVKTRFCIACGYDGPELQPHARHVIGVARFHCPRCDCDLYERPALSYVEREGVPVRAAGPVMDVVLRMVVGWTRARHRSWGWLGLRQRLRSNGQTGCADGLCRWDDPFSQ